MPKWIWLLVIGLILLGGLVFWWAWEARAPSSEAYRAKVLEVLQGGELDPGLAFLLNGIRVDLDCRDEELCTRMENFVEVFDIAEQYEFFVGDYQGRICKQRPSAIDRADHERLCKLLQQLLREIIGIKTNASLALNFLSLNPSQDVKGLLKNFLQRILAHRDRVLQIEVELKSIPWLEPALGMKRY